MPNMDKMVGVTFSPEYVTHSYKQSDEGTVPFQAALA